MECYGGWNNLIDNNSISDIDDYGIFTLELSGLNPTLDIINNRFENIEGTGIRSEMDGVLIKNNTFTEIGEHGINAYKHGIDVINNTISNIGSYGIWSRLNDQLIINNTIINAGEIGISCNSGINVIVDGNQLFGRGFRMTESLTNFVFTDTNRVNGKLVGYFNHESNFTLSGTDEFAQIMVLACENFSVTLDNLGELYISSSDNGEISDIELSGMEYGAYVTNCNNLILNNLELIGFHDIGLIISQSENITVLNSNFSNNEVSGISAYGTSNILVSKCDFSLNKWSGGSFGMCINLTIESSIFTGNIEEGVKCYDSENTSIIGCTINDNKFGGIYGSWTSIENSDILNNEIFSIYLRTTHCLIKGNLIVGFNHSGIYLSGDLVPGPESYVIQENEIKNYLVGIDLMHIGEEGGFCKFSNNLIQNCTKGISGLWGGNYLINGNVINGSEKGIDLHEINNATITNNNLSSVEWGILCFLCTGNITGNNIKYIIECMDIQSSPEMELSDNTCIKDISDGGLAIPGFPYLWLTFCSILAIILISILQKSKNQKKK